MFTIVWVFGFIVHDAPRIDRMKTQEPMEYAECVGRIHDQAPRMADWMRGVLRQDLDFPVGVYGECEPVQKDA